LTKHAGEAKPAANAAVEPAVSGHAEAEHAVATVAGKPAKKKHKKSKQDKRQLVMHWESEEMADGDKTSGESRSKKIFAAKKAEKVPVKKSRPEPQAPTKQAKGAPSSAAEAKEHPKTGEQPKAAPPKMKLGEERKADLNAKQGERRPIPKVGAKGVKARPRPLPKKKRG